MRANQIPSKFPMAFGANAGAAYIRTIPTASQIGIVAGAASLADGFPPLTGTALASGGVPPAMQDFTGILNQATAWDQWTAAAGLAPYDPAFSTVIGGYPQGATVLSVVTVGRVWVSTVDNNTVNPDSAGQTAWLPLMLASDIAPHAGRLIAVQTFTASGTYTPSTGMTYIVVEGVGGGAAGGGAGGATSTYVSLGAPGTAGCYGRAFYTAAQIGASQSVTIGAGGAPVSGGTGGNGGQTYFGSLVGLPGGIGGNTLTGQTAPTVNGNGSTSAAGTGANITQTPGGVSSVSAAYTSNVGSSGQGGNSPLGTGGIGVSVNATAAAATGFGAGGGTVIVNASGGTLFGGAGSGGKLIITEYGY